ncbi:MAG: VRR-NUC domain-containing protein [Oscillospiraceae bacterium]|nr:VRR-NUC domain-containing protein [Oscillospiraceae bacterium]
MTEEHKIMLEIMVAISQDCIIFRHNVGKVRTPDGRYFSTGIPAGYSDLQGHRKCDGRAVYIEVKTRYGRVSPEQKIFIDAMQKTGAIAGVCRSVDDAINLIQSK